MADKEYIEREALALKVRRYLMPNVDIDGTVTVENAERYFLKLLEDAPAVDAVEVRRGEWIVWKRHTDSENAYIDGAYYAGAFCSECDYCIHESLGSYGYPTLKTTNFCPNCGADMRGGKSDGRLRSSKD